MKKNDRKSGGKSAQNDSRQGSRQMRGKQGRKDNRSPRVNFDNERESKFKRYMASEGDASNDYSWYARNKELADAAGRIGFSFTAGLPDANGRIIPGIMVIPWTTSLGGFSNPAINQAKDDVYSYTVHANSRNTSYIASDQMMLILGAKEVFNAIALLIRVYGIMLKNNAMNKYIPRAVVEGSGFNYDDCVANYSHMLFDINQLIAASRQLWIPNTMDVFKREFWMCSHVYFDADNVKGQMYMYTPFGFRTYEETLFEEGATLKYSRWFDPANLKTWDTGVSTVRSMIQKLIDSEDRGVICGDLMKAYGAEKMFTVNYIDTDYSITPVHDKEVLSQISNITAANTLAEDFMPAFRQNKGTNQIYEGLGIDNGSLAPAYTTCWPANPVLNLHSENPSVEEVMIATRMTAVGAQGIIGKNGNTNALQTVIPSYCGTEVAYTPFVGIYSVSSSTKIVWNGVLQNWPSNYSAMSQQDLANFITVVKLCSVFDWAPLMYLVAGDPPTLAKPIASVKTSDYIGDLDNYVVLTDELRRLHIAAVYSEFGVPVLT